MSPKAIRRYKKTYGLDVDSSLPDEEVIDLMVKHCLSQSEDPNEIIRDSLRILRSSTPVDSGGEEECSDINVSVLNSTPFIEIREEYRAFGATTGTVINMDQSKDRKDKFCQHSKWSSPANDL
ncbi:hypothetical protein TTRE_0000872501 [Trichuris trichiura]|uniref:Uncharacterized protein n=1 Tax=Trichuris trichiura TaxID=36087 RepID=A0A077ZNT2_TRITR|nr:hypothetical protein TTRE_0000872501 [Trichuris trichiura]